MSDFTKNINGHTLEYIDDEHLYIVNGIIVPSVTEILKVKFGNKYANVDSEVLKRAANAGTQVHEMIELYCKTGIVDDDCEEVRNFDFLKKHYGFDIQRSEAPVILFYDGTPIAAGRFDLELSMDGKTGGGDIKRTSTLDKEYLTYQLNLYRIGVWQSYGVMWEFLRGIHLRGKTRKFVDIPINDAMAWDLIEEYQKEYQNERSHN